MYICKVKQLNCVKLHRTQPYDRDKKYSRQCDTISSNYPIMPKGRRIDGI